MNRTENEFFEEYKNLDKLLKDCLNSEKGVTSYIEKMEKMGLDRSFNKEYRRLKNLRWKRNELAHDDSEDPEITEDDIDSVLCFYDLIMNRKDPVSLSIHKRKEEKKKQVSKKPVLNKSIQKKNISVKNNSGISVLVWFIVLMVMVIIAVLIAR